jgi:hypothetical protein
MTEWQDQFWQDVVADGMCDCDLYDKVTAEQIACIAKWVRSAHDCYAGTVEPIPENPEPREIERLEAELHKEKSKRGCPVCRGHGRVEEQVGPWFSNSACPKCHGEGKIAA